MAYRRKFERSEFIKLLKKAHSPAECASILGVTRAAIRKEMRKMEELTPKVIALRHTDKFVMTKFNALDQIIDANINTHWLRDQVMNFLKGEKNELREMETKKLLKWVEKGLKGEKRTKAQEEIQRFHFITDPVRLITLMNEQICNQVATTAKVMETMGPVKEMRAVHEAIINYLERNWDPDARTKIMEGIRQEFGADPLLQFGGQKMGDDAAGTGGERLSDQEPTEAEGGDGVDSPDGPV